MNYFKDTFDELLKVSGKTLNQVAEDGGIDRAYLFRLYHGEKSNPSPEIIMRIWIGIILDRKMYEKNRQLTENGLNVLAGSVALTMGPKKLLG